MDDVVMFVGPWDGPVVATAVHAGHTVRPELEREMLLQVPTRLREEDPHTDKIAAAVRSQMLTCRSRFEVDLNRPREEAVYREPDDCWGLDVWRDPPLSDELTRGSLEVYDQVYAALGERLDALAARGPFVVLDVHSYNHRRDGAVDPPAPLEDVPEVNVGTGSVDRDRFGPLVDAFCAQLGSQFVNGHHLDVRENVAFKGRALALFVHERYPGTGCVLAIEFKKTWMDEWNGEVDHEHLEELRLALASTEPVLEQSLAELR